MTDRPTDRLTDLPTDLPTYLPLCVCYIVKFDSKGHTDSRLTLSLVERFVTST